MTLSLLCSMQAVAKQAKGRVCWSVVAPVDTKQCTIVDLPMKIQSDVMSLCESDYEREEQKKKACLAYSANKRFTQEEVQRCSGIFVNTLKCLKTSGTKLTR